MNNIEMLKESQAIKRINEVVQSADVDELASIYSQIVFSEAVCVVSDDHTENSVPQFYNMNGVLELEHSVSHVYRNGVCLGYMDEKNRYQAFQDRFVSAEQVKVGEQIMYAIRDAKTNELWSIVPLERVQTVLLSLNEVGRYY